MRTIITVFIMILVPIMGSVCVASDNVTTEPEQSLKAKRLLPYEVYRSYIDMAQSNFWGNASGADGIKIPLPEGRDPLMPIIIEQLSFIVIDRAMVSGLALACDIEWIEYFLSFMQSLRGTGLLTETQMAFIGMLHGVVQGSVGKELEGQCDDNIRRYVIKGIKLGIDND